LFWFCFLIVSCIYADYFEPSANVPGEFGVNTGYLKGLFRPEGKSIGFVPLQMISPEIELAKKDLPGLLNFYRVFKTNYRFGDSMRSVPSKAEKIDSKTVKVFWDSDSGHPFTITAIYRWIDFQTLDLHITVQAKELLPDFEIFLSSYLSERFPESFVYAKSDKGENIFISAPPSEGVWQAFPRDEKAVQLIQDGRWKFHPSPVDWAIRPCFSKPIIYRVDKETRITVVHMAKTEDCFAVMTPNVGEGHLSMYFSLFGKTLQAEESASTVVRMIIAPLTERQILEAYQKFINPK